MSDRDILLYAKLFIKSDLAISGKLSKFYYTPTYTFYPFIIDPDFILQVTTAWKYSPTYTLTYGCKVISNSVGVFTTLIYDVSADECAVPNIAVFEKILLK